MNTAPDLNEINADEPQRKRDGTHSPPPVRLEAGWRYGAGFYEPLPADW